MSVIIENLKRALDEYNFHYESFRTEDSVNIINVVLSGDNYKDLTFCFANSENDAKVSLMCFTSVKVPQNKLFDMYDLLNKYNMDYILFKYCINNSNEIVVSYTFVADESNVVDLGMACLARIVKVIDEIYPQLMRTLWV